MLGACATRHSKRPFLITSRTAINISNAHLTVVYTTINSAFIIGPTSYYVIISHNYLHSDANKTRKTVQIYNLTIKSYLRICSDHHWYSQEFVFRGLRTEAP